MVNGRTTQAVAFGFEHEGAVQGLAAGEYVVQRSDPGEARTRYYLARSCNGELVHSLEHQELKRVTPDVLAAIVDSVTSLGQWGMFSPQSNQAPFAVTRGATDAGNTVLF